LGVVETRMARMRVKEDPMLKGTQKHEEKERRRWA
jgi:hypothetical protein